MSDQPYPTTLPIDSANRLVQAALGRQSHPVPRLVKDAVNCELFALGQIVGEPAEAGQPVPARTLGSVNPLRHAAKSEATLATELEPMLSEHGGTPAPSAAQAPAPAPAPAGIPVTTPPNNPPATQPPPAVPKNPLGPDPQRAPAGAARALNPVLVELLLALGRRLLDRWLQGGGLAPQNAQPAPGATSEGVSGR